MNIRNLIPFALGFFCLATTFAEPPAIQPADLTALVDGGNAFAVDLYHNVSQQNAGNLLFSPTSIHVAMAIAYAGSKGTTAQQLAAVMHYALPPDRQSATFADLMNAINPKDQAGPRPYQLSMANALWLNQGFPINPDYQQMIVRNFSAKLANLDFAQSQAAADAINNWVAQETKNRIAKLVSPESFNGDTRMVITNAVYFKSGWQTPFEVNATHKEQFTTPGGASVIADQMSQTEYFSYFENTDMQVLTLPYANNELSMTILLPRTPNGLPALEQGLTPQKLAAFLAGRVVTHVAVTFPKFKFDAALDLAETLKAMGAQDAFANSADFSGICSSEPLKISDVIHKATIINDENGTEAAAATAVEMQMATAMPYRPEPPPIVFNANHPFLFLIRQEATGAILFMGRVTDPTQG